MSEPTPSNPYAPPAAPVSDATAPSELELASRLQRLGGSIVDALILMVVLIPLALFVLADWSMIENEHVANAFYSLMGLVLFLVVNTSLLAQRGQTVGKIVAGTRIVRSDGSKASLACLLGVRTVPIWLVGAIPYVGGVAQLVNVLAIFRASRRCLHDDLADTIVIKAS